MPPAYVQSNIGFTQGAASTTLAFASNNLAGSLLLVGGRFFDGLDVNISSVTDSNNGTYTIIQQFRPQAGVRCILAYRIFCNAGANTVTVTFPSGTVGQLPQAYIVEYSGVQNAVFDAATAFATGVGTTATTPALTTTGVRDLVVFLATNETSSTLIWASGPAGYTIRQPSQINSLYADSMPVGPGTYTLSAIANSSITWECMAAAFLGTAPAPGPPGSGDLGPGFDFRFRL